MWAITVAFWTGAGALIEVARRRHDGSVARGVRIALEYVIIMMPRLLLALALATFVAELIPGETVSRWLGSASGFQGILIASVVGIAVPAGGIVAFPLALALLKLGVGVPQLIAFLTSWEVFALHRMLAFEVPFLGVRFVLLRVASSFMLPPVAGLLAGGLVLWIPG